MNTRLDPRTVLINFKDTAATSGFLKVTLETVQPNPSRITFAVDSCDEYGVTYEGSSHNPVIYRGKDIVISHTLTVNTRAPNRYSLTRRYAAEQLSDRVKSLVDKLVTPVAEELISGAAGTWEVIAASGVSYAQDNYSRAVDYANACKAYWDALAYYVDNGSDIKNKLRPISELGEYRERASMFAARDDKDVYIKIRALPAGTVFFIGDVQMGYKEVSFKNNSHSFTYCGISSEYDFASNLRYVWDEVKFFHP